MCIIIDTNFFTQMVRSPGDPSHKTVIDWVDKEGGISFGGKKLSGEYGRNGTISRQVQLWSAAGKAYEADPAEVDRKAGEVKPSCVSDDEHVVALALVDGARTVCTHDQQLHRDITNPNLVSNPRGKIYQKEGHKHLLRHTSSCPSRRLAVQ